MIHLIKTSWSPSKGHYMVWSRKKIILLKKTWAKETSTDLQKNCKSLYEKQME